MGIFRDIIWSALKEGARQDKVPFEFDNFDVGDWLQDVEASEINDAIKSLVESMPKAKARESKKKQK
jgi:hypothetical protein